MNIFHKVALQGLKKNRTRTIVTIIGVVLSAAMITAVTTFGVSLLTYMTNGAAHKYGSWHAAFWNVDSAFVQEQIDNPEVTGTAAFENIGYAPLTHSTNPDKPYLFIAGFNQQTFDTLPITLLSGRLPENNSEILISGKLTADGSVSYTVGDTLSLAVGSRMTGKEKLNQNDPYSADDETLVPQFEKTYTVVGICQTPVFEKDSAPGYTVITRTETADTASDLSLFVTLENPHRVHSYISSAANGYAYILNTDVLRFMGLSDDSSDQIFNALLYSAGGIVIVIIMIGSIFLIYNSFSISLNERTRQIGMLASVGATAKQLRNSVLFEGLCIGAVGIPIGIVLGIGSIRLVISAVAKNFSNVIYADVPLILEVSALAIASAAAVSIITILISAWLPAKKAANTPVMECIRQTNEVKVGAKAVKTSALAQRLYGLEGVLALKNFKRNKKRYRSIVLSLVLSVVLFISTSAFVADLKQAAEQTRVVTSYDIGFGTKDLDDREMLELYDQLKNTAGVSESSYEAFINYGCTVPADELSADYHESAAPSPAAETVTLLMGIHFFDDDTYLKIIDDLGLSAEEYNGQNGKIIAVAKMQDNNNEGLDFNQLRNMFANSAVNCLLAPLSGEETNTEPEQNLNITFVEMVPPDIPPTLETSEPQPYFFQALAPWSLKETLAPSDVTASLKVKGLTFQSETPSQTTAEMEQVIQAAGITSANILLNTSQVLEESRNYIFIANVFAYTFIVMISLIAAANVFNTISTNIKLRRQELAMLRSVGMSERSFNKMMRFECIFYGLRALLFGLPLAAVCSWLIYQGMSSGGMNDSGFTLPWASIGISVCGVLFIVFITMIYAVSKIKKENIIDALRDDLG